MSSLLNPDFHLERDILQHFISPAVSHRVEESIICLASVDHWEDEGVGGLGSDVQTELDIFVVIQELELAH